MIRVAVIDDEPLIRAGLRHYLDDADDIDVVAAAPLSEAVDTVHELHPHVVLLDPRGTDAPTLAAGFGSATEPPAVCVLCTSGRPEHVATALAAGAAGYVRKDTPPDRLAPLVHFLAQGWTMMSADVSAPVVNAFLSDASRTATTAAVARLSPRERQVLALMARGLPNTDIGRQLHLSLGTVKDHVRAVLRKLGVQRRLQAALLAERAGLLTDQP
ncbi:response regulator transcription factor [Streptomyces roseoverticillatus]|uniref:response regulator transcription factor n=1 Tax=Streptomyces roseoverticillatus TaxID=66429 RepID=UPI0034110D73